MKKKILIVIPTLQLGGGAERVASNIGNELHTLGYGIHYFTFRKAEQQYRLRGKLHCLNEKKSRFKSILHTLSRAKRIAKYCKDNKISTIISHMSSSNFAAIASKFFYKTKVVCVEHGDINELDIVYKILIRILYDKADNIIAVSKMIEKTLREKFKIKRTQTIYNCINVAECKDECRKELDTKYLHIFSNSFVLVNIGRFNIAKAQWYLIRIVKKLIQTHPHVKLIILGEGELREKFERFITKMDLEKNVFLLGNQDNIFPFLRKSNCFLLSSITEGLSMVLIEALTANIPIISANCQTGPREILAPELSENFVIKRSYKSKIGVLTKPFPKRIFFKTLEEAPLLEEEEIFLGEIKKIMENQGVYDSFSPLNRANDFNINKIITQWIKIL